jgi:hypothetical protein
MATSMARMRFNATRFISIAALQSIAASSRQGRRYYRRGRRGGDELATREAEKSCKQLISGQ